MSMKEVQLQEISTYSILSDSKQELEKTQHNKYDVDIENARSRCSRDLSPNTKDDLRLRVNARERERMHVINGAMDALRQVRLNLFCITIYVHITPWKHLIAKLFVYVHASNMTCKWCKASVYFACSHLIQYVLVSTLIPFGIA